MVKECLYIFRPSCFRISYIVYVKSIKYKTYHIPLIITSPYTARSGTTRTDTNWYWHQLVLTIEKNVHDTIRRPIECVSRCTKHNCAGWPSPPIASDLDRNKEADLNLVLQRQVEIGSDGGYKHRLVDACIIPRLRSNACKSRYLSSEVI